MTYNSKFNVKLYPLYDSIDSNMDTGNPRNTENPRNKSAEYISSDSENEYLFEDDIKEDDASNAEAEEDLKEVIELKDEHLDKYEYVLDIATGIKLYSGVIIDKKEEMLGNIKLYSKLHDKMIFDEITSSTLTTKGMIKNVDFKDESIIKKMSLPGNQNIVKIGCNEEEIYIYPNEYVSYNITHIMDIVKNSLNPKYKTRIECNCQNLLDHRDKLIRDYESIKKKINIVKNGDIVRRIEKYLLTRKQRNKILLDRLIKIYKKLLLYVFHPYLYDDINILALNQLFDQLEKNTLFERDECIQVSKLLFKEVEQFVKFFKTYVGACKCISQPYNWEKKIQIKIISSDLKTTTKKKDKVKKNKYSGRKSQGCGKYFSSQITFEIYSENVKKIYKIKIFRNGNFQAPGVKNPDMVDIINPLTILCKYLSDQFNKNVYVSHIIPVMRNYISTIMPNTKTIKLNIGGKKLFKTHIYLNKLEEICRLEKSLKLIPVSDAAMVYELVLESFPKNIAFNIITYLPYATIKFSEIINNSNRYYGLLLKFNRPILEKPTKKITVKILVGGKFSFDGCNSEIEVLELYHWLQYIFKKYWNCIMFNPLNAVDYGYVSSDSDDGYESVYDDDEEIVNRIIQAQQSQVSHDPNNITNIIENLKNFSK